MTTTTLTPIWRRAAAAIVLSIAALAAAAACRGTDTTTALVAPSELGPHGIAAEESAEGHHGNSDGGSPQAVVCSGRKATVGTGVFGPAGGTLVFGDGRLFIPGGALSEPVTITASARGGSSSEVDFEPHGLRFRKPAGLALGSQGCALPSDATANVVYVADDGTILETLPARCVPQYKAVVAAIGHFSGYAIAFSR